MKGMNNLCEECRDVANEWDIGIYGMAMIGDEVEDHDCMAYLYPEDKITCECACFKGQHLYQKQSQLSITLPKTGNKFKLS